MYKHKQGHIKAEDQPRFTGVKAATTGTSVWETFATEIFVELLTVVTTGHIACQHSSTCADF